MTTTLLCIYNTFLSALCAHMSLDLEQELLESIGAEIVTSKAES